MIDILKIGVSMGGSMGDILNTTALIVGLKRLFPQSSVTFFLFKGAEVLRGNKTVNTVKIVNFRNWIQQVEKERQNFDIFCEVRYPAQFFFSERALQRKDVREFKEYWEKHFVENYQLMWDEFLSNIPRLNKFCEENKCNVYELRRDSTCLDYTDDDQFLLLSKEDFKASEKYKGLRTAIINNSGVVGTMTKSWSTYGWAEVIKHLKARGLYVIQVGEKGEKDIAGAHARFYGTIHETAALIKQSKVCVFIEGGLVHVAKAVGKKSIVLFGPTPISVFGYKENINLRGNKCAPCWHPRKASFDWNKVCAKSGVAALNETPECMLSLDYREVNKAVDTMMIEQGLITKKGVKNV